MKKYIEGIKFGMVVQLIIGPLCLLVFHTSKNIGFIKTIPLILIIASVDIIYITLACLGVSKLLKNKKLHDFFQIMGGVILIIFGINTILEVFSISIIPGITISESIKNILLKGLLLSLSNPITITYWGSVLTTKLLNDKLKNKELFVFCCGLVSATIIFQITNACIGSTIGMFLPPIFSKILSIIIGIYIIYIGFIQLINKAHSFE